MDAYPRDWGTARAATTTPATMWDADVRAYTGGARSGCGRRGAVLGESCARPTRSSDLALALEVGAQVAGKIGERFGGHLLRWEVCRNLVCADRVSHEIRESNLPARTTLNPRSHRRLPRVESG